MSSYRDHYRPPVEGEFPWQVSHSWAEHTRRALEWRYGYARAAAIVAGRDPATQADVDAWNRLGTRRAA